MDERKYGYGVLRALMGGDAGVMRLDLLGKPCKDEASADYGLQFIEVRADGLYVNQDGCDGLADDEFSALTGDWDFTRRSGLPLLPLPFTLAQLRTVDAALGITERLESGDDTDRLIERVRRANADAGALAHALIYGAPVEPEAVAVDAAPQQKREVEPEAVADTPPAPAIEPAVTAPDKGRHLKRMALIEANGTRWRTIERDLKDAAENGLSAAAKGTKHGFWWEALALKWAEENGKLQPPVGLGLNSTIHRLRG